MLVAFFAEDVAPWFDYIDPYRHFSTTVTQAAAEHPIIKYAIYAISAKMLSVSSRWDPVAADRYQAQCLQLFIPALLNKDPRLEGDFLCATTLILRLYDEMTNPHADSSPQKHVLDTGVIIRSQEPNKRGYSLCQSSLFVAMRQEVHLSVHTGTAPPRLAEHCGVPRTLERTDNYAWTRRILAHLEDVTRFVYGSQTRSPEAWDTLKGYLDDWRQKRPQAFDPVWHSGDESVEFPEMWFANDCHVAGQQYSDICDLLLVLHDPRTPITGLGRMEAARKIEEKVKMLLRRICGVALSNRKFRAAMTAAGMSIVACGDRFTEVCEQKIALEILGCYEEIVQWPSFRAQDRLRALWNL
ncbi:fungal specific transcription factor domain-containing protein [Sarocladium implicatum]|nr:fungal specific transcription factor domain-containing protein [Sarocladium implicatum]